MTATLRKPIPGSWIDPNVANLKFRKIDEQLMRCGDLESVMRRYTALVDDGMLICCVSRDPVGDGELLWHISISHRSSLSGADGGELFTRAPTWDELKRAKYQFAPDDVAMAIMLPPRTTDDYLDEHKTTLHLWEGEGGSKSGPVDPGVAGSSPVGLKPN